MLYTVITAGETHLIWLTDTADREDVYRSRSCFLCAGFSAPLVGLRFGQTVYHPHLFSQDKKKFSTW